MKFGEISCEDGYYKECGPGLSPMAGFDISDVDERFRLVSAVRHRVYIHDNMDTAYT
jgi:hypothetical protein